jgi:hypothetical protein
MMSSYSGGPRRATKTAGREVLAELPWIAGNLVLDAHTAILM